jgi:trypsin
MRVRMTLLVGKLRRSRGAARCGLLTAALAATSLGVIAQPTYARALTRHQARALRLAKHARLGDALRAHRVPPRAGIAVVGGSDAPQGAFGYMAFVLHTDPAGDPDFSCSGTVLSSNVVLTAGHCAVDETTGTPLDPSGFIVVTGTADWTNSSNRLLSGASSVDVNPNYNPATAQSDAALLVLSQPTTAPPLRLATSADLSRDQAGTGALIAGWGAVYAGGPAETYLQWGSTVVQSPGYCTSYDQAFNSSVELCAVDYPDFADGTCNGDSGGPLVAADSANRVVQIGITSRGPTDCSPYSPDLFTRVDLISSWANFLTASVAPPGSVPPPVNVAPPPSAPAITMSDARAYAARMVRTRTHRRPQLTVNCTRIDRQTLHCSIAWLTGDSSYKATGKFWHFLSNGTAYWTYDFSGTHTWLKCFTRHHVSHCTTHRQHFHWR